MKMKRYKKLEVKCISYLSCIEVDQFILIV